MNMTMWRYAVLPLVLLAMQSLQVGEAKTMAEVLAASKPADWRAIDPANTLYMELDSGRVVIELAPQFAPKHVDNIRSLVRQQYFDAQRINRSQDNFVVQWGDPAFARAGVRKPPVPAEFIRSARDLQFTVLPDPDTYAPQTGFSSGFPAGREGPEGTAWAVHCYGMVGVGRDNAPDSGDDSELYVVTGHAPRQLDRNITVVGRVVQGMELLSVIPRGPSPMGVYEKPEQHTIIKSVRVAADVPAAQRTVLEALRTDTPLFAELIEARRNRTDEWYKVRAGRIEVCNVPLPVRRSP
jgi:peptidylprolyl isomerase